ncbi:ABC transporter permease [Paludibacterium denitrificans]|uniref:FtsX-like permease family protein n=1 Tax=Paludibacterium denitrificans TaxID=2675226 RepID=A0A844GCK5_9NEIS|nr:ABC transporter permease [Paludibacterium denitrificans]MTD33482.1 FtsX-like permease family protein [Paludibacterium denitrificans]
MPFEWAVALRLLREGRFQTVLILAGVTIGVAVVVYITAIVNGLQSNIIDKTLSTQAHIVLKPLEDENRRLIVPSGGVQVMAEVAKRTTRENTIDNWQHRMALVRQIPGITAAAAMASGPGFATKGGVQESISLMGVELADYLKVVRLDNKLVKGQVKLPNGSVMIGMELARKLGLAPGDRLRVVSATGSADSYTISAVLDFGLKDLNARWVMLPLRAAQSLLGYQLDVTEIYLKTADLFQADRLAEEAASRTGLMADSWKTTNAQLVTALRSQSASSNMIKVFVSLAIALGIASVLVVSVVQRQREIGILRAMGTARRILLIFLIQGGIVGLFGSVFGSGLGALLALGFTKLARNTDGSPLFPVVVTPSLFVVTAVIATLVGVLAALAPARRAAKLDPVEAIRG